MALCRNCIGLHTDLLTESGLACGEVEILAIEPDGRVVVRFTDTDVQITTDPRYVVDPHH